MNRQYNNYLNRLQELINSKADTYEESILYQIEIVDYKDLTEENQNDDTIQSGILKKVTVTVLYKDGADTEEISLSAIVTKDN